MRNGFFFSDGVAVLFGAKGTPTGNQSVDRYMVIGPIPVTSDFDKKEEKNKGACTSVTSTSFIIDPVIGVEYRRWEEVADETPEEFEGEWSDEALADAIIARFQTRQQEMAELEKQRDYLSHSIVVGIPMSQSKVVDIDAEGLVKELNLSASAMGTMVVRGLIRANVSVSVEVSADVFEPWAASLSQEQLDKISAERFQLQIKMEEPGSESLLRYYFGIAGHAMRYFFTGTIGLKEFKFYSQGSFSPGQIQQFLNWFVTAFRYRAGRVIPLDVADHFDSLGLRYSSRKNFIAKLQGMLRSEGVYISELLKQPYHIVVKDNGDLFTIYQTFVRDRCNTALMRMVTKNNRRKSFVMERKTNCDHTICDCPIKVVGRDDLDGFEMVLPGYDHNIAFVELSINMMRTYVLMGGKIVQRQDLSKQLWFFISI